MYVKYEILCMTPVFNVHMLHLDLAKLINCTKKRIKITATIPTRTQTSESISLIENTLRTIQKIE